MIPKFEGFFISIKFIGVDMTLKIEHKDDLDLANQLIEIALRKLPERPKRRAKKNKGL